MSQSVVHHVLYIVIYSINKVHHKDYLFYVPTETEQRVLLQAHNRNKSHYGLALCVISQASGRNLSTFRDLILLEGTALSPGSPIWTILMPVCDIYTKEGVEWKQCQCHRMFWDYINAS